MKEALTYVLAGAATAVALVTVIVLVFAIVTGDVA